MHELFQAWLPPDDPAVLGAIRQLSAYGGVRFERVVNIHGRAMIYTHKCQSVNGHGARWCCE